MSMQQLPAPIVPQKTYMERIAEARMLKKLFKSKEGWRHKGVLIVGGLLLVAEGYFLFAVWNALSSNNFTMMVAMVGSAINAISAWFVFKAKLFDIPEDTDQSTIAFGFLIGDAIIIALNTWLATVIAMSGTQEKLDLALSQNGLLAFWHVACTAAPLLLHFLGWPLLLLNDPEKLRRDARIKAEQDKQDAELNHEQMEHEAYMDAQKIQLEMEKEAKKADLERKRIEQEAELKRLDQQLLADIEIQEHTHTVKMEERKANLTRQKMENEMRHRNEMLKIEEETKINEAVSDLRQDFILLKAQKIKERVSQVVPFLDEDVDDLVSFAYEKMTGKKLPISVQARKMIIESQPKPKITAKLPEQKEVSLSTDSNNSFAQAAGNPILLNNSQDGPMVLPPNMEDPDKITQFPQRPKGQPGRRRGVGNINPIKKSMAR